MYKFTYLKSDKVTFGVIGLFCVPVLLLSACDLDKPSAAGVIAVTTPLGAILWGLGFIYSSSNLDC